MSKLEDLTGLKRSKAGINKLNEIGIKLDEIIKYTNEIEANIDFINKNLKGMERKSNSIKRRTEITRQDVIALATKLALIEELWRNEKGMKLGTNKKYIGARANLNKVNKIKKL